MPKRDEPPVNIWDVPEVLRRDRLGVWDGSLPPLSVVLANGAAVHDEIEALVEKHKRRFEDLS